MFVQRRPVLRNKMCLQANTINANLLALQVPDQLPHRLRFGRRALQVIIVIIKLGLGIQAKSGLEGELDELVASQDGGEDGLPEGAVLVEGLVDHVPGVALALVVVHDVGDVGDDYGAQLVLGPVLLGFHPGRELRVPDQGVAPQELLVLGGEGGDDVTLGEVEGALGWFGEEPLCSNSVSILASRVGWARGKRMEEKGRETYLLPVGRRRLAKLA